MNEFANTLVCGGKKGEGKRKNDNWGERAIEQQILMYFTQVKGEIAKLSVKYHVN